MSIGSYHSQPHRLCYLSVASTQTGGAGDRANHVASQTWSLVGVFAANIEVSFCQNDACGSPTVLDGGQIVLRIHILTHVALISLYDT